MNQHRLDPLLKPESIALVGVSDKTGSPGHLLFEMVINSEYRGRVFLINPRRQSIDGHICFAALDSLPLTVDHVVLALGNQHLESALDAVIEHGAKAVTIYSSGIIEGDSEPPLLVRLAQKAKLAGLEVCGANGMGFYNVRDDLYAGIFPRPTRIQKGNISYIAQSGSAFTTLCHNGCRLGFNLCVSSGNEMTTTVADYMSWSLAQPDTRVIGLFLEAVRDATGFVEALQEANARDVPVVILKIGKSPLSAEMALTHTGAIAGSHASYEALYRRYGVIAVDDFDEMAAILMLLQHNDKSFPGKLATVQESGGFRELITDIAHELNVDFASISDDTKSQIQQNLDPGLKAENPLDAWGTHDNFEDRFRACVQALVNDSKVAGCVFFSNFRDEYFLSEAIFRVMRTVSQETDKPLALGNCYSDLAHSEICQRGFDHGIAVIDGAREALLAFKHWFAYQQFRLQKENIDCAPLLQSRLLDQWRTGLNQSSGVALSETEAMALLTDFGIATPQQADINTESELRHTASSIGYPLVLKTAETGILHKSDSNGVVVGIEDETQLVDHYQDFCNRLGPSVLISKMIKPGVEVGLGIVNDPQFGPLIMVAAGGVLIEVMAESAVALCPVSPTQARDLIDELSIKSLLEGVRGQAAADTDALIDTIVKLSVLAFELRDVISEIDINPVIVNNTAATAVDALVILRR